MKKILCFVLVFMVSECIIQSDAQANRRRFAYTYETPVLAKGAKELELVNTLRRCRTGFYRRIDNRTEFEWGLGSNFQTSMYLNLTQKSKQEGDDISTELEMSISNEWKYKVLDRIDDPLGFALYGEATISSNEFELEPKIIFDKQFDDFIIAANVGAEFEYGLGVQDGEVKSTTEKKMEFDLGLAYIIHKDFSIGLEARYHSVTLPISEIPVGEENLPFTALFAGPTLSYHGETWWTVLTVMPQLTGSTPRSTEKLELEEHEKMEARLIVTFDF
jgi:hypothetical protein